MDHVWYWEGLVHNLTERALRKLKPKPYESKTAAQSNTDHVWYWEGLVHNLTQRALWKLKPKPYESKTAVQHQSNQAWTMSVIGRGLFTT